MNYIVVPSTGDPDDEEEVPLGRKGRKRMKWFDCTNDRILDFFKREINGEISVRGENIIAFMRSYEVKELSGCKLSEKIALLRVKVNNYKRMKKMSRRN